MSVCYLEADDEITSAIARIRSVSDGEVVIVVPPGSRIATSRINFKLLAREAAGRRLNAVAVSDEPSVRALAVSAGLPAYDSIAAGEQALAGFREQDRRLAERLGKRGVDEQASAAAPVGAGARGSQTMVLPLPFDEPGPAGTGSPDGARSADTAIMPVDSAAAGARRRRRRRAPVAPLLVVGLLALLLGGVAYGAYLFLPTASITIRPVASEIRPPAFSVIADPNVAVVDSVAGVIPAQLVSVPLRVQGTFIATGIEARETRAAGVVRFRSENTLNAVMIPDQTVVSTGDGVEFVTQAAVTLPRASFASGPSTIEVAVRAVRAGTRGNVDADEITRLPQALAAQLVTVRNPEPTSGGRRVEEALITAEDYEAAVAALTGQLEAALTGALDDQESIPRGLVAFADTAELGEARPDQSADAIVDMVAPAFTLVLEADARVVAVNEALIEEVAATRVRTYVAQGQQLAADEVEVTHDAGTVVTGTVVYDVTASAVAFTRPDPQQIVTLVRGKTVVEARQALAQYGQAEINVWPEFIDRLPDQAARISVTVVMPENTT